MSSEGEATIDLHIRAHGLPAPEPEYRFHPKRRWRFDRAWPNLKLALEIEGGAWSPKSRHRTGKGFTGDCEKYSEAAVLGWRVIRATTEQVKSGQAIEWVLAAEAWEIG